MDRSALEFMHELGAAATVPGDQAIALPATMKLHSLEPYQGHRYRYRGAFETTSFTSFVSYCQQHNAEGAAAFIDAKRMSAKAILNLGTLEVPGHGDHLAQLSLPRTAAFEALLKINGNRLGQQAAAEWLEDWRANLTFSAGEQALDGGAAIRAVRNLVIDAKRQQEQTVDTLSTARSTLEQVDAKAKDGLTLPSAIFFHCVPHEHIASRSFALRVSVITGQNAPEFVLRIVNLEQHQELMAQEFQNLLTGALDATGIARLIGCFALGS